jgi:molecular chaperone GrpE
MTNGSKGWASRMAAAWQVVTGSPGGGQGTAVDPRNRLATLELDLRERDAELARVREEYEQLRVHAERERAGAAGAGFDALARRLAPLLSQLATMQALAEGERPLRAEDVLRLFAKIERVLGEEGLIRVGAVGEQTGFDTRLHQRMSGADVRDGDPVTVRFVGYRLGETILLKAMVSRSGAARESGEDPAVEDTP